MKKKLILILSIIIMSCANVLAQSDAFFTYRNMEDRDSNPSWVDEAPGFPLYHGLDEDQTAPAPLGSGLLVMAALGLAYGIRRNNK